MAHPICRHSQRFTTLDVRHGIVLQGLLIAQAFGHFTSPHPGHSLQLDGAHPDLPVHFIVQLLVSGQFERLGSFLFGLGFYRCWQQGGLDGLDAQRVARRLLILLLGIGFCLSLLHKSADLLFQYALLGFTLFYFCRHSVSSLLYWMTGLAGLAILVPSCLGLLHPAGVTPFAGTESAILLPTKSVRSGSLVEFMGWQSVQEWLLSGRSVSQGFSPIISYELLMLGGLLVGKLRVMPPDTRLRVRLSLLQLGVLPLAFLFKGAWVVLAFGLVSFPHNLAYYQPALLSLSAFWGPLLLTGVYLLDVGVNTPLISWDWSRWPARVGKLSLTNYVLQSTLCPLLLYGYGVAVSGSPPVWGRGIIVVAISTLQLGISWAWSKRLRLGPLEWVCRQWILGK